MKPNKKSTKSDGKKSDKTVNAKAKKFFALAEEKSGDTIYGLYVLEGRVYTGRREEGTRAFKSAIPVKIAKKMGLVQ